MCIHFLNFDYHNAVIYFLLKELEHSFGTNNLNNSTYLVCFYPTYFCCSFNLMQLPDFPDHSLP